MRDYLELDTSPPDETTVQVGVENYRQLAIAECRRHIELIREVCGCEPSSAAMRIHFSPHDFGDYAELRCYYDLDDEEGEQYALWLESNGPKRWDGTGGKPFVYRRLQHASL